MSKHATIPDILLERYLLGEIDSIEKSRIDKLINTTPELSARIKKLEKSNRDFFKKYPKEEFVREIAVRIDSENIDKEKISPFKTRIFQVTLMSGLTVVMILVAIFLVKYSPWIKEPLDNRVTAEMTPIIEKDKVLDNDTGDKKNQQMEIAMVTDNDIRLKGMKTSLFIYRKTDSTVELITEGSRAQKDDILQITYTSDSDQYGMIVSLDGRGGITIHYPVSSQYAVRLIKGKKTSLPMAFKLDDAPRFERFFLFTSERRFKMEDIVNCLKLHFREIENSSAASIPLPDGIKYYSITVLKEQVHE